MPKTKRNACDFRFNAKKVGLTYSCPVNVEENPIPSSAALRDFLVDKFGQAKYIVALEKHESGKNHFHAYFHFDSKIDSMDSRVFDWSESTPPVHPNIINKPGSGWISYVKKDKQYISNIEEGPFATAMNLETADEALEHLWKTRPRDMAVQGHNIERNVRARFAPPTPGVKVWYGPYPKHYYPEDWDPESHSLLLWGDPNLNKSQFAMYLLKHAVDKDITFVKRNPEKLKNINQPFVFDEVNMLEKIPDDSREITDVVLGGSVTARMQNADIPPGLPRIFTANLEHPFRNPADAVYGRRLVSHHVWTNEASA